MKIPILPLAEAIRNYPDFEIVLYNRVSSWGQAGRGGVKLKAKTQPAIETVRNMAPGRLRDVVLGVEDGQICPLRRSLQVAVTRALENWKCFLVAPDLSRLIRAEAYNRRTNRNAFPTPEEFEQLRDLTHGLLLATIESPYLSEDKRHSLATRRTGKAGRLPSINDDLAHLIFAMLGTCRLTERGYFWDGGIRDVARWFGVSRSAIDRYADRRSPYGVSWRELALQQARDEGLPEWSYKFPYETKSIRELDRQMEELLKEESGGAAPSAAVPPAEDKPPSEEWRREYAEKLKREYAERAERWLARQRK